MSFQVDNSCYDSSLSATHAVAAKFVPVANSDYLIAIGDVQDKLIGFKYTSLRDGTSSMAYTVVPTMPCHLMTAADGMAVGWLIGSAWLAVYCITFIIRFFRSETGDDYGVQH